MSTDFFSLGTLSYTNTNLFTKTEKKVGIFFQKIESHFYYNKKVGIFQNPQPAEKRLSPSLWSYHIFDNKLNNCSQTVIQLHVSQASCLP